MTQSYISYIVHWPKRPLATLTVLIALFCAMSASGRSAKTAPDPYKVADACRADATRILNVAFHENHRVRLPGRIPEPTEGRFGADTDATLAKLRNGVWFRLQGLGETTIDRLVDQARRNAPDVDIPDLNSFYGFLVPEDICLAEAKKMLSALPETRWVYPRSRFVPAAVNDYSEWRGYQDDGQELAYQQYLQSEAYAGLSVYAAQGISTGAKGTNVSVIVFEQGANLDHDELLNVEGPDYDPPPKASIEHGTATLGIIAAEDREPYGMVGIVPEADTYLAYPELLNVDAEIRFDAIAAGICFPDGNTSADDERSYCRNLEGQLVYEYATKELRRGDVLVVEMQMRCLPLPVQGCIADLAPVEWDPAVWSSIRVLTGLGVVVVEAAGNGGLDLDSPGFNDVEHFHHHWADEHLPFLVKGGLPIQDSGAILVGAASPGFSWVTFGSPPYDPVPEGIPTNFTNFGRRVDLRAAGRGVVTAGRLHEPPVENEVDQQAPNLEPEEPGDAPKPNSSYNAGYAGTSSATALIGGVVPALQGAYRASAHYSSAAPALSALRIRHLLRLTGTPLYVPPPGSVNEGILDNGDIYLNPDALIGPKPNLLEATRSVVRNANDYCYIDVPQPRFALDSAETDIQLSENDLVDQGAGIYFPFRPILPAVPPRASYIAWSTDGSDPKCVQPDASLCSTPLGHAPNPQTGPGGVQPPTDDSDVGDAKLTQMIYSYAQGQHDWNGIPFYLHPPPGNESLSEAFTLPMTIKAMTVVHTTACDFKTSSIRTVNYLPPPPPE